MIEREADLRGRRLDPEREFHFQCGPDLACFNSCCREKRLPLLPYDLVRLTGALGMPSDQFLATHAELDLDPGSGWPVLRLRLKEDGACPLLGPRGCTVYEDRPAACRIYPLTRAVAPGRTGQPPQVVYLRLETSGCQGWDQPRSHTVASWLDDQGLEPYNQANDRLMKLFLHPRRRGKLELTPPQVHAVVAGLYNLDVFARMLAETELARRAGLDAKRVERALTQPEELVSLGQDWLTGLLFP